MKFDETDEKILKNLMVDARLSARQLALKLGMSTVTVLSRIKKLEKEKIILGYTAIIDHEKLGYSLTAIIEIVAKNDKIVEIEDEISKFENVCGVYDITGSTDTTSTTGTTGTTGTTCTTSDHRPIFPPV